MSTWNSWPLQHIACPDVAALREGQSSQRSALVREVLEVATESVWIPGFNPDGEPANTAGESKVNAVGKDRYGR